MKRVNFHILFQAGLLLGMASTATAGPLAEIEVITLPKLAMQADDPVSGTEQQVELIYDTGRQRAAAIGLSVIPGLGQFYNQDYLAGSLYLSAAAALLVLDGVMYFSNGGQTPANPVLLGLPVLSAASMIHAGLQTQERAQIRLTF